MALLHFGRFNASYKHYKALNIFVIEITLGLVYIGKPTEVWKILLDSFLSKWVVMLIETKMRCVLVPLLLTSHRVSSDLGF